MLNNSKKESFFFFCLGLLAILIYVGVIATHAVNMPKWDDFPDILRFLDHWLKAESYTDKLSVFFYHTNEHILLVNHVIILGQYYLTGKLNFAWLIYIGNCFYLGSALVLWWHFRHTATSALVFSLLMLMGLSFNPYESTLWAMTAISNQAVIFFAFLTIYFACQAVLQLRLIIAFATLAIFSQSNGFFLLPLIGLVIFFHHRQHLQAWALFCIAIILLYAASFDPASDANAATAIKSLNTQNYLLVFPIFLASLGGMFFPYANLTAFIAACLLGSMILFLILWQFRGKQYPLFVVCIVGFLLMCLASIGFYRGLFAGPSVAFISRYKMYGMYLVAMSVLLSPFCMAAMQRSWRIKYLVVSFAIGCFAASFYLNLPQSKLIDGDLRQSFEYWVEDGDFRRGKGYFIQDSDSYLFAALKNGSWSPMVLVNQNRILNNITPVESCADMTSTEAPPSLHMKLQHVNRNAPAIRVEIQSIASLATDPVYLLLCGKDTSYQVTLPPQANVGVSSTFYLPAPQISPDHYSLRLQHGSDIFVTPDILHRKANTR